MSAIGGALDTAFYNRFDIQARTDFAEVVVLAFEDVGGAAASYADAIEMGDGSGDLVGEAVAEGVVEGGGAEIVEGQDRDGGDGSGTARAPEKKSGYERCSYTCCCQPRTQSRGAFWGLGL